jgi:hypothetical protein
MIQKPHYRYLIKWTGINDLRQWNRG